jgi:hypothetical protein
MTKVYAQKLINSRYGKFSFGDFPHDQIEEFSLFVFALNAAIPRKR